MSDLICKACGKSTMKWVNNDGDLSGDIKCRRCGHVYHGMQEWINFDKEASWDDLLAHGPNVDIFEK